MDSHGLGRKSVSPTTFPCDNVVLVRPLLEYCVRFGKSSEKTAKIFMGLKMYLIMRLKKLNILNLLKGRFRGDLTLAKKHLYKEWNGLSRKEYNTFFITGSP